MGKFIDALGQGAAGVATSLPGAILGIAMQGANDRRQIRQQQKLQSMQIAGQKEMGEFNYAQQMKMWEETNYSAQKAQLEKAGLNPGLLYGMSGGGGATTGAQSGSVSGAAAPAGGGEAQAFAGMGIQGAQLGLLKAQKENIEADTANKQADTANKPLHGKQIEAQTESITQGITNQKLAAELTSVETRLKGIDERMKNETYKEQVDVIIAAADQAKNAVDRAKNHLEIDLATKHATIDKIRQEAVNSVLNATLTEAQTAATKQGVKLSEEQIKKMKADISQAARALDQNDLRIKIEAWRAELEKSMPGIGNVLGRVLNGAMENINHLFTGEDLPKYEAPKK